MRPGSARCGIHRPAAMCGAVLHPFQEVFNFCVSHPWTVSQEEPRTFRPRYAAPARACIAASSNAIYTASCWCRHSRDARRPKIHCAVWWNDLFCRGRLHLGPASFCRGGDKTVHVPITTLYLILLAHGSHRNNGVPLESGLRFVHAAAALGPGHPGPPGVPIDAQLRSRFA